MYKRQDNKRKLENVNVSVPGTNIGTVTNADGVFSLKIKDTETILGLSQICRMTYLTMPDVWKDIHIRAEGSSGVPKWKMSC